MCGFTLQPTHIWDDKKHDLCYFNPKPVGECENKHLKFCDGRAAASLV